MVVAGEVDNSIGAWERQDPHWNVNYFSVFRSYGLRLMEGDFYWIVCKNFLKIFPGVEKREQAKG